MIPCPKEPKSGDKSPHSDIQKRPRSRSENPMSMTMTEQILARAAEKPKAVPGENIWVNVDVLMTHDVCGPGTFGVFHQHFGRHAKVWDRDKVVIIPDHYIFTHDAMANRNVAVLREFAREQNLPHFYDVGTTNYTDVCH